MGFPAGKAASIAVAILTAIPAAIRAVEVIGAGIKGIFKGKDKQDAAVAVVLDSVHIVESLVGRDLLHDDEVQRLMRAAIDALVALQNVVVRKSQIADLSPASE